MTKYHESVLTSEVISYLNPSPGKVYIDATAGAGGHSIALIEKGSSVLAIDQDSDSIGHIKSLNIKNLTLAQDNFSHIYRLAQENGLREVDGILFDLGVSTHQLTTPNRGFSFQMDGPLDMRMNKYSPISAQDIVNNFDKRRLHELFQSYGQEKLSLAVADAICITRQIKPIEKTKELANIVSEVYRKKGLRSKIHPATKVFQALRIVVNSELLNLEETLPQTTGLLKRGGRVVVISFHSLEDGIVKRFFKQNQKLKVLTRTPVRPTGQEILSNPKARSARLRAAEKL